MNRRRLLALPLLVAFTAPRALEEEIVFRPAKGAEMTLTFEQSSSVELVDQEVTVLVNGEEQDTDGDVELTIENSETIAFRDVVLETDDGRVSSLSRTFQDLSRSQSQSFSGPQGSADQDSDELSDFEDTTVVFTWDEEEAGYTAGWGEDEDGDEALLDDLDFEAHLASLLPAGAVSVDDTWSPDLEAFNLLQSPSGDLHFRTEGEEEDDSNDELGEQMEENLEGTMTCRLVEVREEDGGRLAVIEVKLDLSTSGSETQEIDADQASGTASRRIEVVYDGSGELLWDLGAGRPRGLELEGDLTVRMHIEQDVSGQMEFEVTQDQELEGTFEISVTVE
jgi:hypothetical protein